MADETPTDTPQVPDAQGNNAGGDKGGQGTDTPPKETPAEEKKFTQADLDRIVTDRLKREVKKELKKLAGDNEGQPNVEELQREKGELTTKLRTLEAKEAVRDYLSDPKNKVGARADSARAVEKLVLAELEYDDEGKPTNLKEAVAAVKSDAPSLFSLSQGSVNGGAGQSPAVGLDMNARIRRAAGRS